MPARCPLYPQKRTSEPAHNHLVTPQLCHVRRDPADVRRHGDRREAGGDAAGARALARESAPMNPHIKVEGPAMPTPKIRYGRYDGCAVRYTHDEAWAFVDGEWREIEPVFVARLTRQASWLY